VGYTRKNRTVTENEREFAVGEEWAYRQKAGDRAVKVRILRIGTARPARIWVHYLDEEFEGREDWIPPARLKVPWSGVSSWQEREDRWEAIRAVSNCADETPEEWAVQMVFEVIDREDVFSCGWGKNAGLLLVTDTEVSAALLGIDAAQLLADPLSFVDDDGTLVEPWSVMQAAAQHAAPLYAEKILLEVSRDEANAARRAIYGEYYGGKHASYISPEICAEVDQERAASYDVLRQWCGEVAVERHDELVALRAEVLRIGQITERALSALAESGNSKEAAELGHELGVPLATLRASQMDRRT
jgi:hypothetical protein